MQAKIGWRCGVFLSLPSTKRTYPLPITPPLLSSRGDLSGCPLWWDMGYVIYIYIYSFPIVWRGAKKSLHLFSSPPPKKKNGSILSVPPSHMQGKVLTSWPASIWSKPRAPRRFTTKIRKVTFSLWQKKNLDVVIFNWFIRILMMVYYNESKTFILRKLYVYNIYIYIIIYIYHHFKP